MAETKKLAVTVPEAARMLGIGKDAAYDGVKRNEIPSYRVGRRILVPLDRLHAVINGEGEATHDDAA